MHNRHQSIFSQSTKKLDTVQSAAAKSPSEAVLQLSKSTSKKKPHESLKILSGHRSPGSRPHHNAKVSVSKVIGGASSNNTATVMTPSSSSQNNRSHNHKDKNRSKPTSVNQGASRKESTYL